MLDLVHETPNFSQAHKKAFSGEKTLGLTSPVW
jgi:hypothetical protein